VTRSLKIESVEGGWQREHLAKPFIRLRGRWLSEAGFPPGSRVTVTVEDGRLILTPERSQIPLNSAALESEKTRVFSRLDAALASVQQTPVL
jgi:hypothetical protein